MMLTSNEREALKFYNTDTLESLKKHRGISISILNFWQHQKKELGKSGKPVTYEEKLLRSDYSIHISNCLKYCQEDIEYYDNRIKFELNHI